MLYENSEQIFIAAMGERAPNEVEKKERDSLLGILEKTGFQPEDKSNAPWVLMLAWAWSHGTSRADVLKLLGESKSDMDKAVNEIKMAAQAFKDVPPMKFIDPESVARAVHEKLPTRIAVDFGVVRAALRESFSILWIAVAGACIGIFFWLGTLWGQHQTDPEVAILKNQISSQKELISSCIPPHRK
ncbi:hypothetical protein [Ferrovum myxofaciens]|jgi:hypothetical protein|uniref:hypothetical protein n=1 Tax=Ferrovum myxofaciens TaxID=416213 RepID=UPI0004E1865D|nr:hypothetical protein [Ferrovum myxofaciens]